MFHSLRVPNIRSNNYCKTYKLVAWTLVYFSYYQNMNCGLERTTAQVCCKFFKVWNVLYAEHIKQHSIKNKTPKSNPSHLQTPLKPHLLQIIFYFYKEQFQQVAAVQELGSFQEPTCCLHVKCSLSCDIWHQEQPGLPAQEFHSSWNLTTMAKLQHHDGTDISLEMPQVRCVHRGEREGQEELNSAQCYLQRLFYWNHWLFSSSRQHGVEDASGFFWDKHIKVLFAKLLFNLCLLFKVNISTEVESTTSQIKFQTFNPHRKF